MIVSKKTRKLRLAFLPLLGGVLLLTGCAPSLVGKWKATVPMGAGGTASQTLAFAKDGAVTQTVEMSTGKITATGTYKAERDQLALRFTEFASATQGGTVTGQMPKNGGQDMAYQYKLDGRTLTITAKGKPTAFDRVP